MKNFILVTLTFILALACQQAEMEDKTEAFQLSSSVSAEKPPMLSMSDKTTVKNVIFLIGDGTGFAQITAGQYALVGPEGRLHLQTMPVTGTVKTSSSDNLITDSAAGATAYSCGIKTYNGAIGVNPEQVPCTTILELAEQEGLSTGLISTSSITHATPASYAAHVNDRGMQEDIAADFLDSGAEVFLGGGWKWFAPELRSDSLDLVTQFEESGYQVLRNATQLINANGERLLGLFAEDGMEREEGEPSSSQMVEKALELLTKDEDGFFLMLEGSQIDWAGHSNDIEYLKREMKDFDDAVKTVLDFAEQDGETLVVFTADHETGGLTLLDQTASDSLQVYWATTHHSGVPVPLMAYGPQAQEFMGWMDNTEVGIKLARLLQVGDLPILSE
ncbi:alkaline phosphatase [Gracilimonas mengyeensis]|uniref:Alkaline phosphatase n=1 Tax=Gracilimonas mengyeensis TaxID=1302730 RepID=A0A521AM52_9BACT|nr:alkaline phosphatase [Gracilimonas mengyeensis]SMO35872.1 alkaline phosphatase [Gracilimonas mengyeensis]